MPRQAVLSLLFLVKRGKILTGLTICLANYLTSSSKSPLTSFEAAYGVKACGEANSEYPLHLLEKAKNTTISIAV
jgi:hypothetical protein